MWAKIKPYSTNQRQLGFTIVELLIVIVIIGILAAITVVAYNGIQARARDSQRVSNINTIKKKLDIFYAENGHYPNSSLMVNAQSFPFRRDTLQIPDSLVKAPGSSETIGYCWAATPNQYCYVAGKFPGSPNPGVDCYATVDYPDEKCNRFTLSYRTEQNPDVQVRVNGSFNP